MKWNIAENSTSEYIQDHKNKYNWLREDLIQNLDMWESELEWLKMSDYCGVIPESIKARIQAIEEHIKKYRK